LITGAAEVWHLVILEAINGAAFAMFYPADTAVVPLTVPESKLQEANALVRLGTNSTMILGAALAGGLVAAVNPGWTVAIDAATFLVAAGLMVQMRGIKAAAEAGTSFLADLRAGWTEFTAHRWLWTVVVQFTVMLVGFFGAFMVLGPIVAERDFSGASSWAAVLAGQSAGLMAGGFIALRWRPARPILAGTLSVFVNALPIAALAMRLPLPVIVSAALVNGIAMELFGVFWYTALHEHVAPEALSRVSAYDALGSVALSPVGLVLAGPLAERIGVDATLWLGVALIVVPTALVLLVPEVRTLQRRGFDEAPVLAGPLGSPVEP
jgi:predicted MFS family arabinose efflux permease